MLKNSVFLLALMLSGVVCCVAAQPGSTPVHDLKYNIFDVGEITDEEIADLRHSTCTMRLIDNKKEYSYNYIEGAICPVGENECTYSAIMKLNGNLTILKQMSSGKYGSVFNSDDITITTKQTPSKDSKVDEEGGNFTFNIIIKTKGSEQIIDMIGYCGV